jgi:uridine kinase
MDSVMGVVTRKQSLMFLQFIDPSKQYADIIACGSKNRIAIDIF